jgi:hypothetical protein
LEALVLAVPPAEDVLAALVLDEGAEETLVPDAAATALGLPPAGAVPAGMPAGAPTEVPTGVATGVATGVPTNEARSVVDGARMTWELAVGVGDSGPLAAPPDPTIAALAATVASAAATGSAACQTTEAPAMMFWDSGLEVASATACDVSESGAWRSAGSDDWDAVGMAEEMSGPGGTTRDLLE